MEWNQRKTSFLKRNGLFSSKTDRCALKNEKQSLFSAIYVYDGLILATKKEITNHLIQDLAEEFEILVNKYSTTF